MTIHNSLKAIIDLTVSLPSNIQRSIRNHANKLDWSRRKGWSSYLSMHEYCEALHTDFMSNLAETQRNGNVENPSKYEKYVKLIKNILKKYEADKTHICIICLGEINLLNTENLDVLTCGHFFHKDCIQPWIDTNEKCPLCREHQ